MLAFLTELVLAASPLLFICSFAWAILHGDNRLGCWYRADMRYRTYWLAFWIASSRFVISLGCYVYAVQSPSYFYVLLFTPFVVMPEVGIAFVVSPLFKTAFGISPDTSIWPMIVAYLLTAVAFYAFLYWFLNCVSQSLSRYNWQETSG